MTILALLIALALERVTVKLNHFQGEKYAERYFTWLNAKKWLSKDKSSVYWLLVVLIPAFATSLILNLLPGKLIPFIVEIFVLFVCLGSQTLRNTFKCFLQSASRGDLDGCYLHSQAMGHCDTQPDQAPSFGLRLVWLNYQYYGGVVIAFVIFGAPGAVFYTLVREGFEFCCKDNDFSVKAIRTVRHWVDWVPVRICSLGMLLVGNFANGITVWTSTLFSFGESAVSVITRVSAASEILPTKEDTESDPLLEPSILVKLAKRNMTFILVVVSLLTVFGVF